MSSKVKLLVPEGRVRTVPIALAPRLGGLEGKVIGFMNNGKPNANILLSRLSSLMQKKYGLLETRSRSKQLVSEPADFVEELANECQGVINSVGD